MRREERLAVLLEVGLIGVEHAIEPRQQLLGAVVGVDHNRDTVGRSNGTDVVSSGNSAGNRGSLSVGGVGNTLASPEGGTTLGDLEHDGGLGITGTLKGSNSHRGRGDVLKTKKSVLLPTSGR